MIAYPHESGVSEIDDQAMPCDGCASLDDGECPGGLAFAGGEDCGEPAPDTLRSPPPTGCESAKASFDIKHWSFNGLELSY